MIGIFVSFFLLLNGCPIQLSELMVNNGNTFVDDDQDLTFCWKHIVNESGENVTNVIQEWFQIELSSDSLFSHLVWQSGRIKSNVSFNVFYQGTHLNSSVTYYYRIHSAISFLVSDKKTTQKCIIFNSNFFFTAMSKCIDLAFVLGVILLISETLEWCGLGCNMAPKIYHIHPTNECALYDPPPCPSLQVCRAFFLVPHSSSIDDLTIFRREFELSQSISSVSYINLYFVGLGYSSVWLNGILLEGTHLPNTPWYLSILLGISQYLIIYYDTINFFLD